MCDFRQINKIKILDTNEIIDVSNSTENISYADYWNRNFPHPGFFHVVATGSFGVYWNGNKLLEENYKYTYHDPYLLKDIEVERKGDYTVVEWSEVTPTWLWTTKHYEQT
jgi:hypothetical protein